MKVVGSRRGFGVCEQRDLQGPIWQPRATCVSGALGEWPDQAKVCAT